jgi:hypothetical protein
MERGKAISAKRYPLDWDLFLIGAVSKLIDADSRGGLFVFTVVLSGLIMSVGLTILSNNFTASLVLFLVFVAILIIPCKENW